MTYSSLTMSGSTLRSERAERTERSARHGRTAQYASRGHNAVDFRQSSTRLGPISNSVILIVLACLLGLLYLTQVTKTDAYGYTINNLQSRQTELKQEHDDLVLASAQMQSIDRVQSSPEATAMVKTAPAGTVR